MTLSLDSKRIIIPSPISGERIKGGEKRMASEWEELEKLTKEELIIELVRERTAHRQAFRTIRSVIDIDHPEDRRLPVYEDDGPEGEVTTDEWAQRIIMSAWENADDKGYFDLDACAGYGMDPEQFGRVLEKMVGNGIIERPEWKGPGTGGGSSDE